MKKNLSDTLFGFRDKRNVDAMTAKKEKTLATVNETETETVLASPRTYRTVGLTEARLRARNKKSWTTSTKGWSDFFGRFMRHTKG